MLRGWLSVGQIDLYPVFEDVEKEFIIVFGSEDRRAVFLALSYVVGFALAAQGSPFVVSGLGHESIVPCRPRQLTGIVLQAAVPMENGALLPR